MKKCIATFLALSLALSLFCGASALASDFKKCGEDLTWSVVDGVLTISGTGDMYDYSSENPAPWTNVLREIIIEPGVTSIGDYAFHHVEGNITFTKDPDTGEWIVAKGPVEVVSIPEGMRRIGERAFAHVHIEEIEIPATVTEIESDAFAGCIFLKKAVFLGAPETIGIHAFGTSGLEEIIIPERLKTIGDYAFSGCRWIKRIYIPASVESIGKDAFFGTASVESIEVSEDNENYKAVGGCLIETEGKRLLAAASDCAIPADGSVEIIGGGAFANRTGLVSLEIPEGVKEIEDNEFACCENLVSVFIPKSVEKIGTNAFRWCNSLVIRCYSGSFAHRFAEKKGIAFELVYEGDFDNDGDITVADALSALRIAARLADPVEKFGSLVGDMDGDGEITVSDAIDILRIAARLTK